MKRVHSPISTASPNAVVAGLLSAEASEVTAVVQMAMLGGLRYQQVRDAVITHPTMAEGLQLLFSDAFLK
ncbi:hypothetical protein [Pseudarthrobacter sp. TAF60_1]|uniref:hypothetical protein n=1 Tax=Pseudarthrobacter sp. TAF60_1 TaxID=3233071 RepID=UPI003F9654DC